MSRPIAGLTGQGCLTLAALTALLMAFPSFFPVLREVFSAPVPAALGFAFFRLSLPEPILQWANHVAMLLPARFGPPAARWVARRQVANVCAKRRARGSAFRTILLSAAQ